MDLRPCTTQHEDFSQCLRNRYRRGHCLVRRDQIRPLWLLEYAMFQRLALVQADSCIVQAAGIVFEATRLVMVQRLLSSADFKMDPMVSLYYFAPACAVINGVIALFIEIPKMSMTDIYGLGVSTLLANAFVAFLLNVAVVLLVDFELLSS